MNSSSVAHIDWSTAEINDGTLSVALEGEAPKGFAKRVRTVLAVLDHGSGGWGEIAIHKNTITVAEIGDGSEDELRHLLESALLQANADLEQTDTADPNAHEPDNHTERERAMTNTFRSFGRAGEDE
jgi:hypothetical protein